MIELVEIPAPVPPVIELVEIPAPVPPVIELVEIPAPVQGGDHRGGSAYSLPCLGLRGLDDARWRSLLDHRWRPVIELVEIPAPVQGGDRGRLSTGCEEA